MARTAPPPPPKGGTLGPEVTAAPAWPKMDRPPPDQPLNLSLGLSLIESKRNRTWDIFPTLESAGANP